MHKIFTECFRQSRSNSYN